MTEYVVYVSDSWGQPVAGAAVTFEFYEDPTFDAKPFKTATDTTDANGAASVTESYYVPNGLKVEKLGYTPYSQKGNLLDTVTYVTLAGGTPQPPPEVPPETPPPETPPTPPPTPPQERPSWAYFFPRLYELLESFRKQGLRSAL